MPRFHPPLSHSSTIHIDSTHPYIQLNFFAVFAEGEDLSGSWQIWSDLPQLDEHGATISRPGEWTATDFRSFLPSIPKVDESQHINGSLSNTAIHVRSRTDIHITSSGPPTLFASIIIPATDGARYSYTYRHITPSNEIHWLGGVGGNGIIRMTEGERVNDTKDGSTGIWSEVYANLANKTWAGFALSFQPFNGSTKPLIHELPADSDIAASLALLTTEPLVHQTIPFDQPTRSSSIIPPSTSMTVLAVLANHSGLHIGGGSPLPEESDKAVYSDTTGSFVRALAAALRAPGMGKQPFDLSTIAPPHQNTAALLTHHDGRSGQAHLVVFALNLASPQEIKIALADFDQAPLAAISDAHHSIIYIPECADSSDRELALRWDKGLVAEVIQLSAFTQLRGAGKDDPIWICAPDAASVEIGEEEICQAHPARQASLTSVHNDISPKATLGAEDEDDDPSGHPEPSEAIPEDEAASEAEGGSSLERPNTSDRPQGPWWLFRFIGRFFVNIWQFLFSPFRSRPAITSGTDEVQDAANEESPSERTPLLGSHSMSRDTSSSSTAVDPLATPASLAVHKDQTQHDELQNGLITPVGNSATSEFPFQPPVLNAVQIRSYAQMSFKNLPPFRFLLPPNPGDVAANLRFLVKEKAGQKWERVEPELQSPVEDGRCQEMMVQSINGTGGTDWEVQIERI
ncbi:uncharacterized protein I206_107195 [Kwoniella pini CBS 10737]|uniref:Uncharacterized protein n=1 Tax=Kwoniella pini CBS 10737 TaxID=1296096 RepID=A0A1B9HZ21_9TREE|nr:uncharacterized protein I206_05260 [Kwoniella pini CBS 10737]OCF48481.1 hypothetical protein I206_05260 [Kwoniella pini CBS 10737]